MLTGEMAEWSNAVDSKSIVRVSVPGVQIPLSPPVYLKGRLDIASFFVSTEKPFQTTHSLFSTDGIIRLGI